MSDVAKQPADQSEALVPGGFGDLPAIQEPTTCALGAVPYLAFFDRRSTRAVEVSQMVPGIADGDPYLGAGMLYQSLKDAKVLFAKISPFFQATFAEDFVTPVEVKLTEFEGSKEVVVVAGLAEIGDGLYPFVATLRTTKVSPAKVAYQVAAASEKKGWADNKVKQGLLKLPPMLRHYGVLTSTQKTSKYTYYVARWVPQPLTVELATAVFDWLKGPEKDILTAEFDNRVKALEEKMQATEA